MTPSQHSTPSILPVLSSGLRTLEASQPGMVGRALSSDETPFTTLHGQMSLFTLRRLSELKTNTKMSSALPGTIGCAPLKLDVDVLISGTSR